jgi:hypothetical protein
MSYHKLPNPATAGIQDGQTIQVSGAEGMIRNFVWDAQTRTFNFRESQLFTPTRHGDTHISTDPIPAATCDTPGLMAPNDKCRLDALSQTRFGVLGYAGAGMPDDGGWLQDDIILSAGNNGFLSIERVGNVIRFTVTPPTPYACACEACATLFWVFDETEPFAIRPPTCTGKLPGVDIYGEVKCYLMPEALIVDPANPAGALNTKGNYPALVFKRYNNALTPGLASFELVLQRDSTNASQAIVGWSMLPGATGSVECVWFTGKDDDGNLTRFALDPKKEPGVLGGLLYNGHLITKRMAIVTSYLSTTPSSNVYSCRLWDVLNARAVGDEFTATNVWNYDNVSPTGTSFPFLLADSRFRGLLPLGSLVDIWAFEVGEGSTGPIYRYFMSKEPVVTAENLWSYTGGVQFGDTADARTEVPGDATGAAEDSAYEPGVDFDGFESGQWGLANDQDVRFYLASASGTVPSTGTGGPTNSVESFIVQRARVSTDRRALLVANDDFSTAGTTGRRQKPVHLWNRVDVPPTFYAILEIGFPDVGEFNYPLLDLLWGAVRGPERPVCGGPGHHGLIPDRQ